MKKSKCVSWKVFTKKIAEICEAIKNLDSDVAKTCAAEYACFQIITEVVDNHYEGLGILQEVMLSWRDESLVALNDELEHVDKN